MAWWQRTKDKIQAAPSAINRAGAGIKSNLRGDESFHPRERMWLIFAYIGVIILCVLVAWFIKGADKVFLIVGISVFFALVVDWLIVFIDCDIIIAPELTPNRLEDKITILEIPRHLKPQWDYKGNVPPFINEADGSRVYFAERIDYENKVIEMCHNLKYTSVDYMTKKGLFLAQRRENAQLRDRVVFLSHQMEAELQRRLANLCLESIELNSIDNYRYNFDFDQNRTITRTGQQPFSLMGGDPLDMTDPDEREEFEERLKLRAKKQKEGATNEKRKEEEQ